MEHKTKVTVTYAIEGEDRQYEVSIPIKGDERTTISDFTKQFSDGFEVGMSQVMDEFASALIRHMAVHTSLDTTGEK